MKEEEQLLTESCLQLTMYSPKHAVSLLWGKHRHACSRNVTTPIHTDTLRHDTWHVLAHIEGLVQNYCSYLILYNKLQTSYKGFNTNTLI